MIEIPHPEIRALFEDIFARIPCSTAVSKPVIDGLIETSLRGVDSHGIRLMPHYVRAAMNGRVNVNPTITCEQTSPTTVVVDADHTFGMTAASRGMENAVSMARESGMGAAAIRNSTHFGAAAIYALQAARQNMIGLSFTHSDALVVPHGGRTSFLGTNPICFAVPCDGEEPFCLDMATSVISWNKLMQHREAAQPLSPGWAADAEGRGCVDPLAAAGLLPIGGYKGYGLALMVEILCSSLTGMPFGPHISRMFPLTEQKRHLGHFVVAIDISRFSPVSAFKARVRSMIGELRAMPPFEGVDHVRVAGDVEKEHWEERHRRGIPLPAKELVAFREISALLQVPEDRHVMLKPVNHEVGI